MKPTNKTILAGIVGVFLLAALVIGVNAYAFDAPVATAAADRVTSCPYHEDMERILETGTYDELVALRLETGRPMLPLVTDEQTFAQVKEHHAYMETTYGEDARMGQGCGGQMSHATRGLGRGGGCAMRNAVDN